MEHLNEGAVPVPFWPESKPLYKPRRRSADLLTYRYLYPALFYLYMIALWILFAFYKLTLVAALKIYVAIRKLEKERLKRRLVIIGGGYAGTFAAKSLQHDFLVTMIDNKDYFEFTPSKLRILVEPHHVSKVQMKHQDFLSRTRIITDWVKHITPDSVITENQTINYDYLLICTGSRTPELKFSPRDQYDGFHKNSQVVSVRTQHFENYHSIVASANSVLIIGGGTVGVELAGEMVERYKDKEITIVQSSSRLMPRSPDRAIRYTEEFFKRNGTTLIFGDKVVSQEGSHFITQNGISIEADIAFLCTGNVPNTEFMRNQFFQDSLNVHGFVKVNPFLQLQGYPNIYVAGDLTDIPEEEEKLCQTAANEVKTVVNNIKCSESGLPLAPYSASKCPMLVSLGKYDGMLMYRGWTYTGFVPAAMKEFVEWKEMVHYWNLGNFHITPFAKEQWSSHAHIV